MVVYALLGFLGLSVAVLGFQFSCYKKYIHDKSEFAQENKCYGKDLFTGRSTESGCV